MKIHAKTPAGWRTFLFIRVTSDWWLRTVTGTQSAGIAPFTKIDAPKPSPHGEGAPKGRIGHWQYEKGWENASQVDDLRKHPIHR